MMKKYLLAGTTIFILLAVSAFFFIFSKEVDDIAENGPIQSTIIMKMGQVPLFEDMLAAGISWDYDKDRFFISTDQPHSLFADNIASFYVVNASLEKIAYKMDLEVDGDLEGIAYIGFSEVAIISEVGTLYYLKEHNNKWKEVRRVSIFSDPGKHKIGSLAYDPVNKRMYTAEKEGDKTIYVISRNGKLIDSFNFNVGDVAAKRKFELSKDYTISGMTFENRSLYIFSEAYSTLFKYNPDKKILDAVYGIKDIHESAGITLKNGIAYLVGDFESYLPAPSFYKVIIPN